MGCGSSRDAVVQNPPRKSPEGVEVTLQDYKQRELLLPEHERSDCNRCCVGSRKVGINDSEKIPSSTRSTSSAKSRKVSFRGMLKRSQYSKLKNEINADVVMPKHNGIEVVRSFDLEFGVDEYHASKFRRKASCYEEIFCPNRNTVGKTHADSDFGSHPRSRCLERKNSWPRDGRHYVGNSNRKRLRHWNEKRAQQLRPSKRARKVNVNLSLLPHEDTLKSPPFLTRLDPFASMEVLVRKPINNVAESVTSITSITDDPTAWSTISSIAMEDGLRTRPATPCNESNKKSTNDEPDEDASGVPDDANINTDSLQSEKTACQESADESSNDVDPRLKDDPEFSKYFKMIKVGMPKEVVAHAMQRDGKDPSILDLDPEKSLVSQRAESNAKEITDDGGPPLKEDPEFAKYFKMMKAGMPKEVAAHAMQRDGKDPSILNLDPEKSLESQRVESNSKESTEDDGPPLKEDPEFVKYFKMMKVGMPKEVAAHAMQRDGKDPSVLDLDSEKSLKSQIGESNSKEGKEEDGPPLKDDPEFSKYFKMMRVGMPKEVAAHAMQRDGKDPTVLELDPEKSLKSQRVECNSKESKEDDGPPLKDDPDFIKYFKMMKVGMPKEVVAHAMQRDSRDPSILDLDPEKSFKSQTVQVKKAAPKEEKKKVRRKKIFWTPISEERINDNSIWSMCRGCFGMDTLKYDAEEFNMLFTETSDPSEKKIESSGKMKQQKVKIQLIDGKRGMNGGIILARIKIEYSKLAQMVDTMEPGELDSTQLRALKEYLPTDEERNSLNGFLTGGGSPRQDCLSECEKYMMEMLKVKNPAAKFDCMLFRSQFTPRLDDIKNSIEIVDRACDEVKSSEKLRGMMAIILTVVNHINTGGQGHGNVAAGFGLDALLKLQEAKAFDRKTSVLEYLVKLVKENNESLLEFKDEIDSISDASTVQLDSLENDCTTLRGELSDVEKTTTEEADRIQQEISEVERESSRLTENIGLTLGSNSDHGRTPMETFVILASLSMAETEAQLDALKGKYGSLLQYFGEDESMQTTDFFGTIHRFVLAFSVSVEEVGRKERAKLKEKFKSAARKVSVARKMAKNHWKNSPKMNERKGADTKDPAQLLGSIGQVTAEKARARSATRKEEASISRRDIAAAAAQDALGAKKNTQASREASGSDDNATAAAQTIAERFSDNSQERSFIVETKVQDRQAENANKPTTVVDAKRPPTVIQNPIVGQGGIAAAAAAAAAARRLKNKNCTVVQAKSLSVGTFGDSVVVDRTSVDPVDVDAAMPGSSSSSVNGKGDIAAASALPADKKEGAMVAAKSMSVGSFGGDTVVFDQTRDASSGDKMSTCGIPSIVHDGKAAPLSNIGIAAAAAAAARRRVSATGNSATDKVGIAAAAAAAAALRSKGKHSVTDEADLAHANIAPVQHKRGASIGVGIAAAAAAAARSRHASEGKNDCEAGIGVIAESAAAAAAKRATAARNRVNVTENSVTGRGGIFAAAAAAAALRSKGEHSVTSEIGVVQTNRIPVQQKRGAPNDLGIAAAAAAAAARNRCASFGKNGSVDTVSVTDNSVTGRGSIAAAAAAAANARRSKEEGPATTDTDLAQTNSTPVQQNRGAPADVGIAARNPHASVDKKDTAVGVAGIAEAGEAVAAKPKVESAVVCAEEASTHQPGTSAAWVGKKAFCDDGRTPSLGRIDIASAAAFAARNRQSSTNVGLAAAKTSRSQKSVEVASAAAEEARTRASPLGGIAAAAAAAAAMRVRKAQSSVDQSQGSKEDAKTSVAAAAALAAALKRREEAHDVSVAAANSPLPCIDSSKDAAAAASEARLGEAVEVAAVAAKTAPDLTHESSKAVAAMTAAARQQEAASLAQAALKNSARRDPVNAKAAVAPQNEAVAVVAASLEAS